jgi:hypothetical protein
LALLFDPAAATAAYLAQLPPAHHHALWIVGVLSLLAVIGLLGQPLTNSLTHFNEPDGIAKALVKTIEYRAATPSRLEEVLFYDHPAVGRRIRNAMDWKAAHPKTD